MATPKDTKEPGRLKSMWRMYRMTAKSDRLALPLSILVLLAPIAIAVLLTVLLIPGDVLFTILWIISGVLVGVMLAMMVMTSRAERVAFAQIEGKPGAVGAVLSSGLRGSWQTSEMPVAVNPKTQDAIYRAVGRPGVVLIAEGPTERVKRLVADEQRKVKRILGASKVPVHVVHVGPDSELQLRKLTSRMRKLGRTLQRAEVVAVTNRLTSLGGMQVPIPKGVDPRKMRAGRPR